MAILSYQQVSKKFGPEVFALQEVSFSVDPGEMIILTGQTGSGKTTLMKLLTREYAPSAGEIYFKETPVHQIKMGKVHTLRRQIGIVFQDYRLIRELNVWENIATPLFIAGRSDREIEQRVSDLLNLIKLTDKADAFPAQLSGGEAQRVAIARSLALAPDLIFADEPTGNLDSTTSAGVATLLAKINELGTTILIATHDLTLLDMFSNERHIILDKGRITSDGRQQSGGQRLSDSNMSQSSSSAPSNTNYVSTTVETSSNATQTVNPPKSDPTPPSKPTQNQSTVDSAETSTKSVSANTTDAKVNQQKKKKIAVVETSDLDPATDNADSTAASTAQTANANTSTEDLVLKHATLTQQQRKEVSSIDAHSYVKSTKSDEASESTASSASESSNNDSAKKLIAESATIKDLANSRRKHWWNSLRFKKKNNTQPNIEIKEPQS